MDDIFRRSQRIHVKRCGASMFFFPNSFCWLVPGRIEENEIFTHTKATIFSLGDADKSQVHANRHTRAKAKGVRRQEWEMSKERAEKL